MKHYETAIKFEKACNVRRALETAGKKPTIEDDRYIHELRDLLDRVDVLTGDIGGFRFDSATWRKIAANV